MQEKLSEREERVLESLIQSYISETKPIGSSTIVEKYLNNISSATVRNTMMSLEEKGYVKQPYTSAGREPTDKGYRYYVDSLMKKEMLNQREKRIIEEELLSKPKEDVEKILEEVSRVIADISHCLGLVLAPCFEEGILDKLELLYLSERKFLVVLTIKSGLVKTVVMEVNKKISKGKLFKTNQILNERLSGLSIREIKEFLPEIMKYPSKGDPEILDTFVQKAPYFLNFGTVYLRGRVNIISQPEFANGENVKGFWEILDTQDEMIELLNQKIQGRKVNIIIGSENVVWQMRSCSLIVSNYNIGDLFGTVGMIGPTRMRYSKCVPVVEYVAKTISNLFRES